MLLKRRRFNYRMMPGDLSTVKDLNARSASATIDRTSPTASPGTKESAS